MPPRLLDYLTLTGTLLSVIGVAIALFQLSRTRRAAEAAQEAASASRQAFARALLGSDVARCAGMIEEIKTLIRLNRLESTRLRVSDLMNLLLQLRQIPESRFNFQPVLVQLGVLRDLLEAKLTDEQSRFEASRALKTLAQISDEVNGWLGHVRFAEQGDER